MTQRQTHAHRWDGQCSLSVSIDLCLPRSISQYISIELNRSISLSHAAKHHHTRNEVDLKPEPLEQSCLLACSGMIRNGLGGHPADPESCLDHVHRDGGANTTDRHLGGHEHDLCRERWTAHANVVDRSSDPTPQRTDEGLW
eukprot:CAMPEP_0174246964 /NCGR_PEP_ID=MMETSP0417-20130205/42335_1 /TAXON_ID=242541 /ORGANISM="Mayorella sp, Strain BSH-02190019" /LENGTH=141 /DNA_ID=CAMNT_0015326817 /DNA_START=163 /DNA_END=585 /DNA_ORIENTATION=+